MGRKSKSKDREKRRQQKRQRQQKRRKEQARSQPKSPTPRSTPLDPPHPDKLLPAIHVDAKGQVVADPRAVLGLGDGPLDEAKVRRAWREALVDHPPEADPEGARRLREARDRLLDPDHFLERELGVLCAPDPDAWELPDPLPTEASDRLDAEARLAGQAVLYALLEDELKR